MLACIRNDEPTVRLLLEMGADPDTETPPQGAPVSNYTKEQGWKFTSILYQY